MIPDKKNIHILNPEQITEPVSEPQIRGFQLKKSPQQALTTANNETLQSSGGFLQDSTVERPTVHTSTKELIENMRTRISELETALINLGLLRQN